MGDAAQTLQVAWQKKEKAKKPKVGVQDSKKAKSEGAAKKKKGAQARHDDDAAHTIQVAWHTKTDVSVQEKKEGKGDAALPGGEAAAKLNKDRDDGATKKKTETIDGTGGEQEDEMNNL